MWTWLAKIALAKLLTPGRVDFLVVRICDLLDTLVRRTHTDLDDKAAAEVRRVLTSPEAEAFILASLKFLATTDPQSFPAPQVPLPAVTRAIAQYPRP